MYAWSGHQTKSKSSSSSSDRQSSSSFREKIVNNKFFVFRIYKFALRLFIKWIILDLTRREGTFHSGSFHFQFIPCHIRDLLCCQAFKVERMLKARKQIREMPSFSHWKAYKWVRPILFPYLNSNLFSEITTLAFAFMDGLNTVFFKL